jgi:hypothetical protein
MQIQAVALTWMALLGAGVAQLWSSRLTISVWVTPDCYGAGITEAI